MLFVYAEKEEKPTMDEVDFDPAHPSVLLLVCKWYGQEEQVSRHMVSLYPNINLAL